MKIRFTQNLVVPGTPEFLEGQVYDVEDTLADVLVSRGQAEYVSSHAQKEESVKPKKNLKKS